MSRRTMQGQPLAPGYNVDAVNLDAGLDQLRALGYQTPAHRMETDYNLRRWQRGEEAEADHSMARSLSGISYSDWRVVLATAIAADPRNPPRS